MTCSIQSQSLQSAISTKDSSSTEQNLSEFCEQTSERSRVRAFVDLRTSGNEIYHAYTQLFIYPAGDQLKGGLLRIT